MELAGLFPDGDYRFHLTLRREEPARFFAAQDPEGRVLAERRRWIAAEPARYARLLPEGECMLREFAAMAARWRPEGGWSGSQISDMAAFGAAFEPDLLFLSEDPAGEFRLRGGALCFPTGWALEEKLGQTLEFIHGVVPGLNQALAQPISQFLRRLKPGVAFLRDNWGIAASKELNLHPSRQLPAPRPPVRLDDLWLRVEHQALLALPTSKGVAFGIRISLHRLDAVAATETGRRLAQALRSMPEEMAIYKRLDAVRGQIADQLTGKG